MRRAFREILKRNPAIYGFKDLGPVLKHFEFLIGDPNDWQIVTVAHDIPGVDARRIVAEGIEAWRSRQKRYAE